MKSVVIALIMSTSIAQATEYKQFFLTESGKQIDNTEAIMSAAQGTQVYKCQSVEFKVSKSGTSIGLKNVKKPKSN